jgi:hypothetical protein
LPAWCATSACPFFAAILSSNDLGLIEIAKHNQCVLAKSSAFLSSVVARRPFSKFIGEKVGGKHTSNHFDVSTDFGALSRACCCGYRFRALPWSALNFEGNTT